ncbi:hypothetical protein EVAR_37101_1 [Eumeta japonica]|uniref:Uncharacterized protein n=1 Tax=Eumeta variegata TaxID=151549 RepID=A0A4C1XQC4_EUMVA|nr:hypothetical protein EVAR_37101_1 [Eumeta japonica]
METANLRERCLGAETGRRRADAAVSRSEHSGRTRAALLSTHGEHCAILHMVMHVRSAMPGTRFKATLHTQLHTKTKRGSGAEPKRSITTTNNSVLNSTHAAFGCFFARSRAPLPFRVHALSHTMS